MQPAVSAFLKTTVRGPVAAPLEGILESTLFRPAPSLHRAEWFRRALDGLEATLKNLDTRPDQVHEGRPHPLCFSPAASGIDPRALANPFRPLSDRWDFWHALESRLNALLHLPAPRGALAAGGGVRELTTSTWEVAPAAPGTAALSVRFQELFIEGERLVHSPVSSEQLRGRRLLIAARELFVLLSQYVQFRVVMKQKIVREVGA
jgi:hypothetical protein